MTIDISQQGNSTSTFSIFCNLSCKNRFAIVLGMLIELAHIEIKSINKLIQTSKFFRFSTITS